MKLLKYSLIALISISLFSCEKDDVTTTEPGTPRGPVIYLADNGVTVKAGADAVIGDTASMYGILYTVVDRAMLLSLVSILDSLPDNENVCVSKITDMNRLFQYESSFNRDISSWDVSNVTDMSGMFEGASSFNQDISWWDVSNVTDMEYMFEGASSFNQDLYNWDVDNVTDCGNFYRNANSWTQRKPFFEFCFASDGIENLCNKNFVFSDLTYKVNGITIYTGLDTNYYPACNLDDIIRFYANGEFDAYFGAIKCDPNDPQGETRNWAFSNSDTKLMLGSSSNNRPPKSAALNIDRRFDIITNNGLELTYQETEIDSFGGNNIEYTVTYRAQ